MQNFSQSPIKLCVQVFPALAEGPTWVLLTFMMIFDSKKQAKFFMFAKKRSKSINKRFLLWLSFYCVIALDEEHVGGNWKLIHKIM